ncbi:monoamine oxidase [Armatimonadetes bacterium GXS]|nr:monoamine oxidase [Armatimonadetes bacterium GXS]
MDTIVVGAGIAGLTCAHALAQAGKEVLVLEARSRVGGRIYSHTLAPGVVIDLGAQWLGPTQERAYRLAQTVGTELFPTYAEGESLVDFGGQQKRYTGIVPNLGLWNLLDFGRGVSLLDKMAQQVPLEAPWRAPNAEAWDSMTFATWIQQTLRTRVGRWGMRLFAEAVFAAEPGDFSLLHALFYLHSGGGFERLTATRGGAQQDRFVHGAQALAEGLAQRLGAERLKLNSPVRAIRQERDRVRVYCQPHPDEPISVYEAKVAIVAIPPALAARIEYDPPLPPARDQLTQRLPQGSVIKCFAVYDRPFWREQGLNGFVTSDVEPVHLVFDNSPPDGSVGILLGFIEGRAARQLSGVDPKTRREVVLGAFARYFGARARQPEHYLDHDWSAEVWTRGCYGAHFPPGAWSQYGHALRMPVGRILWAGTETATRWMGYIDGAIESGERAAQEALEQL